ncbi:unnamed protein product, partial [Didymodactylos carnosus]
MLGATFRIDEVRFDDEKEVWVIKLTMCSENENELRDEFNYYRQDMGEHIDPVSLRNLMWRIGDYDMKAIVFYKRYLEEDPDSSASCTGLVNVAGERGEIDVALEYFSKALEIDLKTLSPYHPYIAIDHITLGINTK